MSVIAADVERWARALGVWRGRRQLVDRTTLDAGPDLVVRPDGHGFTVQPRNYATPLAVDTLTLAIILIGHARGLRVDVGECPACRARGSRRGLAMWEWAQASGTQMGALCNRMVAEGSWSSCSERGSRSMRAVGPCVACKVDGSTTGRHTLTWEAAIIAATPRPCSNRCADGVCSQTNPNTGDVDDWPCPDCVGGQAPGDTATREALRVMAHTIAGPEHVAIVGDWCAGHKRNTTANFPGEPEGGLGALVAAWLRGACEPCNGHGKLASVRVGVMAWGTRVVREARWPEHIRPAVECSACNGHGSVLGGFERELAQAMEAELGRRAA